MSKHGWSIGVAALLFAAPRVVLMIPGLLATVLAKWRHPRPLWRGAHTT